MGNGDFDQQSYWIKRHKRLRGDPRSVGNLGKSLEENLHAEKNIKQWMGCAANLLRPCSSVLDIGCGYGRVAAAFCDAGYDYTGVDVSSEAVAAARRNEPRGTYIEGSALEVDFGRKFDLVCVLYVFVHFVDDQKWRQLIAKLTGSLEIGGGLLFADVFPEERTQSVPHAVARPLSMYDEIFEASGMKRDPAFRDRLAEALDRPKIPSVHLARRLE